VVVDIVRIFFPSILKRSSHSIGQNSAEIVSPGRGVDITHTKY
jgi:hypothetical protein